MCAAFGSHEIPPNSPHTLIPRFFSLLIYSCLFVCVCVFSERAVDAVRVASCRLTLTDLLRMPGKMEGTAQLLTDPADGQSEGQFAGTIKFVVRMFKAYLDDNSSQGSAGRLTIAEKNEKEKSERKGSIGGLSVIETPRSLLAAQLGKRPAAEKEKEKDGEQKQEKKEKEEKKVTEAVENKEKEKTSSVVGDSKEKGKQEVKTSVPIASNTASSPPPAAASSPSQSQSQSQSPQPTPPPTQAIPPQEPPAPVIQDGAVRMATPLPVSSVSPSSLSASSSPPSTPISSPALTITTSSLSEDKKQDSKPCGLGLANVQRVPSIPDSDPSSPLSSTSGGGSAIGSPENTHTVKLNTERLRQSGTLRDSGDGRLIPSQGTEGGHGLADSEVHRYGGYSQDEEEDIEEDVDDYDKE